MDRPTPPSSSAAIPNLLSLRNAQSGTRGRGRGRGGLRSVNAAGGGESDSAARRDLIIQQTDEDASVSRASAVTLGYLQDLWANAFVKTDDGPSPRRYVIINRGTYVRTTAIDTLVNRFLTTDPEAPKQIISLGAGSDTRFFRLAAGAMSNQGTGTNVTVPLPFVYHEIDFPTNTASKIATIRRSPGLWTMIQSSTVRNPSVPPIEISPDGTTLSSGHYYIHALDLRSPPTALDTLPNISRDTPTLILSEMCLIYLPPTSSAALLTHLSKSLFPPTTPLSLIVYEPIRPNDPFGETMQSNLAARGIHLASLQTYASLASQRERMRDVGLEDGQCAADMLQLFSDGRWVSAQERLRIARCEFLDEVEEWELIARHYCVAWGWRGKVFEMAWRGLTIEDEESSTATKIDAG